MIATLPWYDSAVWTFVGVLVAVVVGAAGLFLVYLARTPRCELTYGLWLSTPLLRLPSRPGLQVLFNEQVLAAPHVLWIVLTNTGRRDIPSSAFDQGRPLVLDVGIAIVEVLGDLSNRPSVTAEHTTLSIEPTLIRQRQSISFTLLCDGRKPTLTCHSPLIDVRITQDSSAWTRRLTQGLLIRKAWMRQAKASS